MVARIATYSFTGDAQELGERAKAGILPIIKAQPGFKSYSVAIGEGKVFHPALGKAEPTPRAVTPQSPPGSQKT